MSPRHYPLARVGFTLPTRPVTSLGVVVVAGWAAADWEASADEAGLFHLPVLQFRSSHQKFVDYCSFGRPTWLGVSIDTVYYLPQLFIVMWKNWLWCSLFELHTNWLWCLLFERHTFLISFHVGLFIVHWSAIEEHDSRTFMIVYKGLAWWNMNADALVCLSQFIICWDNMAYSLKLLAIKTQQ